MASNRSASTRIIRRGVPECPAGWLIAALLSLAPGIVTADPAVPYAEVPGPFGGDILAVSGVTGPPPGDFWVDACITQHADTLEAYRGSTVTLQYGLHPRASFGIAASHYLHDRGFGPTGLPVKKQGPGDTRLFVKWCAPKTDNSPFYLGLRPSLRIPTGYDREGDDLLRFTTRTVDFELLGVLAIETPRVAVYLNPGISLPGGKWHNELLGGLGFNIRGGLPFDLTLNGEYFTRYDIPEEVFHHEIYGMLGRDVPFLPLGLTAEIGFRKVLAQGEETGPQMTFRLRRGRTRGVPTLIKSPPGLRPTRVLVRPIISLQMDPLGLSRIVQGILVRELSRQRGISASVEGEADYTAELKIVNFMEGTGRSVSIPRVLATPRATLEIVALVTVKGPEETVLLDGVPLTLSVSRGTGVKLFPAAGDEDTWVPTAQSRTALRTRGFNRLAQEAAKVVGQVVADREGLL